MILNPTKENLALCAERINRDELVAVPTETVYGLAGNALSEVAVRKIFQIKGRPLLDPLIVHCYDFMSAVNCIESNSAMEALAEAFWPGPLTLIAKKKADVPDIVTAGLSSVAIRIPAQNEFRILLKLCGVPLAAPSANPFGYVSPTRAAHVERTLGDHLPAILDGGACQYGVESTIIDLRVPMKPVLLRYGPINKEAIEAALKLPVSVKLKGDSKQGPQTAPGMLSKHYSPRAKVHLAANGSKLEIKVKPKGKTAFVFLSKPAQGSGDSDIFWLSENGCPEVSAHNLFALLQRLDQSHYKHIVIELALEDGIGQAINDRLRRAAAE